MANYQSSAGPIARGDAFLVQTPQTDQAINELQAEQARREAFAQRESLALDSQMSKEFANVRNVDAPDVINSYNQYKNIKKQIYFNPKVQNDPVALAKLNQQANAALGNTWSAIDKSREMKQTLQDLNKVYGTHPERFIDGFPAAHQQLQATPTSKLDNFNINSLYDETPNADIAKITNTAAGKPAERYSEDTPYGTEGIQATRTPYLFTAPPAQFAESLINQFHAGKSGKYAVQAWNQLSPEEIAQTDQAYNEISPDKWKKMTGTEKPQDLPEYDPQNPATNYALYLTKRYAIHNEPQVGKPSMVTNEEKKIAINQANREKTIGLHYEFNTKLAKLRSNLALGNEEDFDQLKRDRDKLSETEKDQVAQSVIQGKIDAAKKVPAVTYTQKDGSEVKVHLYAFPSDIENEAKRSQGIHQIAPKFMGVTDDGKIVGVHMTEMDGKKIAELKEVKADDAARIIKNKDLKPKGAGEQPKPTHGKSGVVWK